MDCGSSCGVHLVGGEAGVAIVAACIQPQQGFNPSCIGSRSWCRSKSSSVWSMSNKCTARTLSMRGQCAVNTQSKCSGCPVEARRRRGQQSANTWSTVSQHKVNTRSTPGQYLVKAGLAHCAFDTRSTRSKQPPHPARSKHGARHGLKAHAFGRMPA